MVQAKQAVTSAALMAPKALVAGAPHPRDTQIWRVLTLILTLTLTLILTLTLTLTLTVTPNTYPYP